MTEKAFIVFLDEIAQNFVWGEPFADSYTKTVTLSDGSTRAITLTPTSRSGKEVIELNDNGSVTYMGPNGTQTRGNLMIQVREVPDDLVGQLKAETLVR
jgi:hypothetical protein